MLFTLDRVAMEVILGGTALKNVLCMPIIPLIVVVRPVTIYRGNLLAVAYLSIVSYANLNMHIGRHDHVIICDHSVMNGLSSGDVQNRL